MNNKKNGRSVTRKQQLAGWGFLTPATILILIMSFYPIVQAIITSFRTGTGVNVKWATPLTYNYAQMFKDKLFLRSVGNTFLYLLVEVPVMLILAILLAQLLNNKDLKFRGFFRTCIFLPCATSLVSYSLIFKILRQHVPLIQTYHKLMPNMCSSFANLRKNYLFILYLYKIPLGNMPSLFY